MRRNQKHYAEAAAVYEKLNSMTNKAGYLNSASQSYLAAGKPDQVARLLQQWLRSHPEDVTTRHHFAEILEQMQRKPEAAEQYRILVKSNPKDFTAYNNLALVLNALKDTGAMVAAEKAAKLAPDNPDIQDTLGLILIQNNQAQRGMALIKQAYDKQPESLDFEYHYAQALAATGDRVLARMELDRLLTRGKNFAQADEARKLMNSLKR